MESGKEGYVIMDYKDAAIFSVWAGTVALSALFLYFDAAAEIVLLFWLAAIGLTVWLAQVGSKDDLTRSGNAPHQLNG
jgi:hypothetical protein